MRGRKEDARWERKSLFLDFDITMDSGMIHILLAGVGGYYG